MGPRNFWPRKPAAFLTLGILYFEIGKKEKAKEFLALAQAADLSIPAHCHEALQKENAHPSAPDRLFSCINKREIPTEPRVPYRRLSCSRER